MTPQEHAVDAIKIALFAIGKIRAMRLTPGERQRLHRIWDDLSALRNSVTEADTSCVKIRASSPNRQAA